MKKIYPVILSGGSGTRLWPLSRELYPKQFLTLNSNLTLLQDTALRVQDEHLFFEPLIICNAEHRFLLAEQIKQISIYPKRIVLEPCVRNTAPAITVAALLLAKEDPEAIILVLPSDHKIEPNALFFESINKALPAADQGQLVTFGIQPSRPESGYGYIQQGAPFKDLEGCFEVKKFIEKPSTEVAQTLIESGGYFWNTGIFLFNVAALLKEVSVYNPDILKACELALEEATIDFDFLRLNEHHFSKCPSVSIDYAVMEHTSRAGVVSFMGQWDDVGSWGSLWENGNKDVEGNVKLGQVFSHEVSNSYLRSDGPLLTVLGLNNVVAVATRDAVFLSSADQTQSIKTVIEILRKENREELKNHTLVCRPWGSYQTIDKGDRFQVKRIKVKPGARLSLQKHQHRAEHWVVVKGKAQITNADKIFILKENESTYIPMGAVHRLENIGETELELIEVQSGSYLGEDDIIRLEDIYGRTLAKKSLVEN